MWISKSMDDQITNKLGLSWAKLSLIKIGAQSGQGNTDKFLIKTFLVKIIYLTTFSIFITIHHYGQNYGIQKNYVFDKTSLLWYSLLCWWNSFFDESLSHGWKHITLKKIHHFGEHSSIWWKFITLMKAYHFVKYPHFYEKFLR